jgi:hypothetical protein
MRPVRPLQPRSGWLSVWTTAGVGLLEAVELAPVGDLGGAAVPLHG